MLIEFARNYEMLGNTQYQLARAEEAHRFMIGLAAEETISPEEVEAFLKADAKLWGRVIKEAGIAPQDRSYFLGRKRQ
jgi:hypothetical protein